jgi:O-antigen/teichoic acid export membrane protein
MELTALVLMLGRALSIVGLVILAAAGLGRSAAAIALIWLAAGLVFAAFLCAFLWNLGIWPPAMDRDLFRRMVALSIPLIGFAVSQYVIGAVDVVILGAYRPSRDVGLYAIAYQGYGVLQQIATTATIVLSPLFVSLRVASREHVIERYQERTIPQVVLLASVGAGLVAPFVRLAVPAVFGSSFAPTYEPLVILLVAWVMFAAASFAAPILVLHERARSLASINALAAVINVIGDWLLIGVLGVGIAGPALATAGTLALVAVGYIWVAADCIGSPRHLPLAMIAPAVVGVALALTLPSALGAAASVAGTLLTAIVVLRWQRPFAAQDVDLIGRLDIPGPFKQLTLKALARLG